MNMLERHCGTKKYKKRVFLITDGEKPIESRAFIPQVEQSMKDNNVRFNVIAIDFANEIGQEDDEDIEEKENEKAENIETKAQLANKELCKELTESV